MKVYKFGGASVKDGFGIINLTEIVSREQGNLAIVVSAFGKTTNMLEKVLKQWIEGKNGYSGSLDEIYRYHTSVINELFPAGNPVQHEIDESFNTLRTFLKSEVFSEYDYYYDQIVSMGEVWSTLIVAGYLKSHFEAVEWIDLRKYLLTDQRYRDANVLWDESTDKIREVFNFRDKRIYVTQGFIAGTADGKTTTLGREGSDYTAAILANMLDAESVTVWKDVPGILNADPKWMKDTVKLDEMSYKEAVEMTFSGAKVIHPNTIKPLHNKNIHLHVKSFLCPEDRGTVIKADPEIRNPVPVFIKKEDQILISILPNDFSFVMGDNLSRIFRQFTDYGIKVNLVEASAISIDVCINEDPVKVDAFIRDLKPEFTLVYNDNVEMLSIRHYTNEAIRKISSGREILLEQRTRSTVRIVVRKI